MKSTLGDWVKEHAFNLTNLLVLLIGFAYQYGTLSSEMHSITGDHERRIFALEKKTDDLSVLKNIVETQSVQIRQLADTVSRDHDVLIRIAETLDRK